MVQEKYDTWRLPCSLSRNRIATGSSVALRHLSTADRSYGWDASAVFLDGCYPRPPAAEELRADFLFLVSGAGIFLRRFASGAERAAVLLGDSSFTGDLLLGCGVRGRVVPALTASTSADRIRADTRTASCGPAKTTVAHCGLSACDSDASVPLSCFAPSRRIRFHYAQQFVGSGLSSLVRCGAGDFRWMAMEICESGT